MYVLSKNIEKIKNFLMKILNFHNFRKICILHGRVFIMKEIHNFTRQVLVRGSACVLSLTTSQ